MAKKDTPDRSKPMSGEELREKQFGAQSPKDDETFSENSGRRLSKEFEDVRRQMESRGEEEEEGSSRGNRSEKGEVRGAPGERE